MRGRRVIRTVIRTVIRAEAEAGARCAYCAGWRAGIGGEEGQFMEGCERERERERHEVGHKRGPRAVVFRNAWGT